MSTDLAHPGPARPARAPAEVGFAPDTGARRYGAVAIALHWLIGIALIAELGFGFLLPEIAPRGTPARAALLNQHKSIGIVLGIAVVLRLGWRLAHRPPPWPRRMPAWQARAAGAWHRALYACMLVQPLSGYVASNFSRRGVVFFGQALAPWGPDMPAVYRALQRLHDVVGYVLAALVVLHVAAALKHLVVDRDGVFARMWPWGTR